MVSGTVGSSGAAVGGGVLGGLGLGVVAGNLLSKMSGLKGISPVWRKAERMVVFNLWRRPLIDMCATQNSICTISNHKEASIEPNFV